MGKNCSSFARSRSDTSTVPPPLLLLLPLDAEAEAVAVMISCIVSAAYLAKVSSMPAGDELSTARRVV